MPPPVRAAAAFGIAYRPEREDDLPFVAALYASTREREFAHAGLPPETMRAFLAQQHRAQHAHYRTVYPAAEWLIIEAGGEAVGRLYLDTRAESLHIIDLSIVPERRGGGLGSALFADLIAQGESLAKPVSLQVGKTNPARHLYERLGFRTLRDSGFHDWMERPPGGVAPQSP